MTPDQRALYQQHYYEQHVTARVFAVISWGAAATEWLARALNTCPGIFCVHAQNFFWRTFSGASVDGLRYLQIVEMQGHSARAAGDVHGISRIEIPQIKEFFGDKFRAAVVVRDPLPRLYSQLALFDNWIKFPLYDTEYLNVQCPDAIRLLPTGNYEERLLVHGVNMLNSIIEEVNVGPVFRMEDLTSDATTLLRLVEHLSAGDVLATTDWANMQVKREAINRHNQGTSRTFAPWQKSVVRATIKRETVQLYRDFGYDTSWLNI